MIDIIDEINADLHKENVMKYLRYLLGFVLVGILGASVSVYMRYRFVSLQEQVSSEYYRLFEAPSSDRATQNRNIEAFIERRKGNIYASLAALRQADALIAEEGKHEDAAQILLKLISSAKSVEAVNAAKIRLADLALNHNDPNYKSQAIQALQSSLTKDGFMVNVMKIMLGQLLMEAGEQDKARATLSDLRSGAYSEKVKFIANVLLDR